METLQMEVPATIVGGPGDGTVMRIMVPAKDDYITIYETCRARPEYTRCLEPEYHLDPEAYVKYYVLERADHTWRLWREPTPPKIPQHKRSDHEA